MVAGCWCCLFEDRWLVLAAAFRRRLLSKGVRAERGCNNGLSSECHVVCDVLGVKEVVSAQGLVMVQNESRAPPLSRSFGARPGDPVNTTASILYSLYIHTYP